MKLLAITFASLFATTSLIHAQTAVYVEDFSSPGSVSIEPLTLGNNGSRPFEGNNPDFQFGDFASVTSRVSPSVSGGVLDLGDPSNRTAVWHAIDTSGWAPNDYTVSFTVADFGASDDYSWGITGGSGMTGAGEGRVRTGASLPRFRQANNGATATDLVAGNLDSTNASDYLTISVNGLQSFDITMTASEVGTAGDYLMIGWGMEGASDGITIDDLTITPVPEPSSMALVVPVLGWVVMRRRV